VARDDDSAKLLAALRAQDPAVARALWKRFAPLTFRLLGRTLGPGAPLDRAAEVVLLCVFQRAARVRSEAKLNDLVLKVTARVAQAELRRRRARNSPQSTGDAPLRFYRILDGLGAADRIAFVFHHIENLDVRVVAAAMGGTVSGTTRRLRRALRMVFDGIQRDPVLRALPEPRSRATRDSVMFEPTTRGAAVPRARSSAR
jgi:DNA-directed RNA polymerase specialized sigma24 family protein